MFLAILVLNLARKIIPITISTQNIINTKTKNDDSKSNQWYNYEKFGQQSHIIW